MGLGEFSAHFLFWILEQSRERPNLTLLLDEPDAYLPPVGVASLLARILDLCDQRGWSVVIATHAEEMIQRAIDQQAFTLVRINETGVTTARNVADHPLVGSTLLTRPGVDSVLFCEDESGLTLARAVLDVGDIRLSRRISIAWGGGDGYMHKLQQHLPRPPRPDIRFAYVLDGDQRHRVKDLGKWKMVCLPTTSDPDTLFAGLAGRVPELAERLGVSQVWLDEHVDSLEGGDTHDWVNDLGAEYGRPRVLATIAALWAEANVEECEAFVEELRLGWT